jgi:hypothetical protein
MLALLKYREFNLNYYKTAFAIFIKDKKIIQILIPISYSIAVTNLTYRLK